MGCPGPLFLNLKPFHLLEYFSERAEDPMLLDLYFHSFIFRGISIQSPKVVRLLKVLQGESRLLLEAMFF